ncbi:MAG: hypothetical protein H0W62_12955 [Chitinophagales bacterium]|nr:hypothetical protein [Chitinophagales bacterium]
MKDAIYYRVPFGFIGDVVNEVTVKKKVEGIFNFKEKSLQNYFNPYQLPG